VNARTAALAFDAEEDVRIRADETRHLAGVLTNNHAIPKVSAIRLR
jgi:hypothetical protein